MSKTTIERVPRKVFENKLLANLIEQDMVAILATKGDLDLFIAALEGHSVDETQAVRIKEFAEDLRTLRKSAFP